MRSFAVLLTLISALPAIGADIPSGDSLLARFVEVTGGEAAYAKVKNVSMNGVIEMAGQNIAGSVSIVEAGEKAYMAMDFSGIGKIEECYDGVNAWESSAISGPRLVEGEEKASIRRASSIAVITAWRDLYKEARTIGTEDLAGKPAWKVEMVPKEGKPETFYFDQESGLLVRVSSILSSVLGEMASDLRMSDYREIDGIRTPSVMTEQMMSQNIVMRFTSVVYNGTIPADRFDPPAEVKALLAKKK